MKAIYFLIYFILRIFIFHNLCGFNFFHFKILSVLSFLKVVVFCPPENHLILDRSFICCMIVGHVF